MYRNKKIFVIIPVYKVKNKINLVIQKIPAFVDKIFIIDDACPDNSSKYIINKSKKINILINKVNMGVGGAVKRGFHESLKYKFDLIFKIDGDDQMDLSHMQNMCNTLIEQKYDYVKGNRFYFLSSIKNMPILRVFGNSILSFFSKISSGYWDIFDPTNGYFVINKKALETIQYEKLSNRYFFESDILFRLRLINAKVKDFPMKAIYQDEKSNLRVYKIILPFLLLHFINFIKRFFYCYILRDTNIATIEFIFSIIFLSYGFFLGISTWIESQNNLIAPIGSIVLSAMLLIMGLNLLLSFINYDVFSNPNRRN